MEVRRSDSRPVAPRRSARRKASSVFSGAWALPPRWAKPIGTARSGGRRVATAPIVARSGPTAAFSQNALKAGEYLIPAHASMADIMDTNPDNSPVTIALREVFYLE